MEKKLLFFDIDGTLIDYQLNLYSITELTRKSLDQLKELGHSVFLATGRCKCFIVDGVADYDFSGYVTCNGAYVEYEGKTIYKEIITKEALEVTHQFCNKYNMLCYFENTNHIYVNDIDSLMHQRFKDGWGMKDEIIIGEYNLDEIETYLGMIVINDEKDIEVMIETLSPYFDIQKHQSGESYDLTLKGISKAVGIEKLVARLDKNIKDTIAFGDGHNDIEMLKAVGIGVAMGNAFEETKAVADYVTADVNNDGITKALEHLKLI